MIAVRCVVQIHLKLLLFCNSREFFQNTVRVVDRGAKLSS